MTKEYLDRDIKPLRGSLGFQPCDGCTRENCADVCPSWPDMEDSRDLTH